MSDLNDRKRCLKCFIIVTERCKMWLLKFILNRLPIHRTLLQHILILKQNTKLKPDHFRVLDRTYQKILNSGNESDADVSSLCKIAEIGNILLPKEEKQWGQARQPLTIGDQVYKLSTIRNELMHICEVSMDEIEYSNKLADFKDLATFFEGINACPGKYNQEIEDIDSKDMDSAQLKDTLNRYKEYVELVIKIEMPSFNDEETCTVQAARAMTELTDIPLLQAAGGLVGGSVGLVADFALFLTKPLRPHAK